MQQDYFDPAPKCLDPTYDLVRSPKPLMTPEQLDAMRPNKPVAPSAHNKRTAKEIAYVSGIREIEGIVLRIEALEAELAELKTAPGKK